MSTNTQNNAPVGYVSRDASFARMTTNLPEGSLLYAAPVAAQPDLTQQTLDDVKAGIPARDAEIDSLRKEIEVLRACAVPAETLRVCGVIADKIEDGSLFMAGIYRNKDLAGFIRQMLSSVSIAKQSYPLNLDPAGIRALTADAISGALALGYQGVNPPPDNDHWLAPFWKIGRESAAQAQQPVSGADLSEALRDLIRGYVNLLENGRDRIRDLGGQCDPVDVMEASEPWLKSARAALAQQDATSQAEVLYMVLMLEANEWADHCGKSDLGQRLEWAITALQNRIAELTKSSSQQDADKVDAERWRAYRAAIATEDSAFLGRGESYLSSLGLRAEALPTEGQIDAAIDAARKEQA